MADGEKNSSDAFDGNSQNPFDSELQSDFSSSFGAEPASSFSQVFKEGGFIGENRNRLIALLLLLAVVIAGAIYVFQDEGPTPPDEFGFLDPSTEAERDQELSTGIGNSSNLTPAPLVPAGKAPDSAANARAAEVEATVEEELEPVATASRGEEEIAVARRGSSPAARVRPARAPATLRSPPDGARRTFDDAAVRAQFEWDAAGGVGRILFSRSADMKRPVFDLFAPAEGRLELRRLLAPGTWYWQVRNSAGSSEVRSFAVEPAPTRTLALVAPQADGRLAAQGGAVRWTGDRRVAYYKVELSRNGDFANPVFSRSTTGTEWELSGQVPAGDYQLRIGGFSEVAGQWEFTQPVKISIDG